MTAAHHYVQIQYGSGHDRKSDHVCKNKLTSVKCVEEQVTHWSHIEVPQTHMDRNTCAVPHRFLRCHTVTCTELPIRDVIYMHQKIKEVQKMIRAKRERVKIDL